MESEDDEESTNSIMALSGSLISQAVHSSTPSLPTNPRQPAWPDIQTSELDMDQFHSLAPSLPRAQITSATNNHTHLEASSISSIAQKRETHHYNHHQNVHYRDPFHGTGFPPAESSGWNSGNEKQHASEVYLWRAEDPLNVTAHSTSSHSLKGQVNKSGTNDFHNSIVRSGQRTGSNRQFLKKRPSEYLSSPSNSLYSNDNSVSNPRKVELYPSNNFRSMQAHSSSAVCQADSSEGNSNSLQHVFPSTSFTATRNMNPASITDGTPNKHFLRDQTDQMYSSSFSNFKVAKKPQASPDQTEALTFDHQQVMDGHEAKQDFDFSFNERNFPSISFATDFSLRNRPIHQLGYQEVATAHNELLGQTGFTSGTSTNEKLDVDSNLCTPAAMNSNNSRKKRAHIPEEVGHDMRITDASQRKTFENQDLSTTLETSLPGCYVGSNNDIANFKQQDFTDGSQLNLSSQINSTLLLKNFEPLPEENNSWMGRSRAHRKMARLLGNANQATKHSSNDPKPMFSHSELQTTAELQHKNTSQQSIDDIGSNFQTSHSNSLKDHCNFSRDFLALEDDLSNLKAAGNPPTTHESSKSYEGLSKKQLASGREFFPIISNTAAPNFMYEGSAVHNLPDDTVSQRAMEFPIFTTPNELQRDNSVSNLPMTSINKSMLDADFTSVSIHKDSVVSGFFLNPQQSQQPLGCLDFAPSERELDLSEQFAMQDPKDFDIDAAQVTEQQMDLSSFDQVVDSTQPALTLSGGMALGPHNQQELNLEAYFDPQPSRDQSSNRKLNKQHSMKDISGITGTMENDFDLDDFVNPPLERDTSSSYFIQPNMPQDMTVCQKPVSHKLTPNQDTFSECKQSERQSVGRSGYLRGDGQEAEFSKVQRELSKTSSRESMKGIRNPRDIGRAMEILQSLKAEEEEQYQKQQEWKRQQHQHLLQQQEHEHQQDQELTLSLQQQQQPLQLQHQAQGASLNSSPKKTFQNKHYFESLSLAIAENQLLGNPESLMDSQAVGNFLDQSQLDISDQTPGNLQMMQNFQTFAETDQPSLGSLASDPYGKKDLNQTFTYGLDYHVLKKIAFAAALKEPKDHQASFPSMSDQPGVANLSNLLSENSTNLNEGHQGFDSHYTPPKKLLYSQKQGDFESFSKSLTSKDSLTKTAKSSKNRMDSELPFPDLDVYHQPHQTKIGHCRSDIEVSGATCNVSSRQENISMSSLSSSSENIESMMVSRQNMYTLMKAERFCDAILSTHKQTVKVHQLVLCSMSQYLSNLLHKMSSSASSASSGNIIQPPGTTSEQISYKPKLQSSSSQQSQLQPVHEMEHSQQTKENFSLPQHATVLLVVNCEDIKATSLQTFLVYIYTGQPQLSESNVCDLFLLASSLRINCLKDKCRDFMQKEHMSEDKLKVPELVLSSSRGGRHFQQDIKQGQGSQEQKEVEDKACSTADDQQELLGQKMFEDRGINTVGGQVSGIRRNGGHMEVATQTDRSTHEVGVRGSQEEWVMLKKTKQKTVSPSKSKSVFGLTSKASTLITASAGVGLGPNCVGGYGPHGKLLAHQESLSGSQFQHFHKLGKKSWLSPKRRYKTELHQTDAKTNSAINASSKNGNACTIESVNVVSIDKCLKENPSASHEASLSSSEKDSSAQTCDRKTADESAGEFTKTSQASSVASKDSGRVLSDPTQNVTFPMIVTKGSLVPTTKRTRTTVEIAEEAAAAKVCAHSYGTRTARGAAKIPISYAALASGNRKKHQSASSSPSGSLGSKKKALTTSSSHSSDSNSQGQGDDSEASKGDSLLTQKSPDSSSAQQTSQSPPREVMCPLKKKIAHRTESREKITKEAINEDESSLPPVQENTKMNEQLDLSSNVSSDKSKSETSKIDETCLKSTISDSDLVCSTIMDGVETVISSSSSNSNTQPNSAPSSSQSSNSSTKTKAILQNFRKRLIHQLNSEQSTKAGNSTLAPADSEEISQSTMKTDPLSTPSCNTDKSQTSGDPETDTFITENSQHSSDSQSLQSEMKSYPSIAYQSPSQSKESTRPEKKILSSPTTSTEVSEKSQTSKETPSAVCEAVESSVQNREQAQNTTSENQVIEESEVHENPRVNEHDLESETKEQGAVTGTDQEEEIFAHKIFKRKKKMKVRKLQVGEIDYSPALKCKKTSIPVGETSSAKARHRKVANGSDTEGSTGRTKLRKTACTSNNGSFSNSATGNTAGDDDIPKVRAPPKKRAKMEQALLKAANLARRAVEERKSESHLAAMASSQLKLADKEEQEDTLQHQQEISGLETITAEAGNVTVSGGKRSLLSCQKKVAKRKPIQTSIAKPTEKLTADGKNEKLVQPQPLSEKLKRNGNLKTMDENTALISSLALKLRAKFKEYSLSLDIMEAGKNEREGVVRGDGTDKESFTKFYSCSLCQLRLQSARRMVKHVRSHGTPDDKVLDTVVVGRFNQEYEACDICGYETKDKSYQYMHYHKYFRHGVPLPLGWQCDKCKICGKTCATAFQFKEHMLSHEQPSRFICWHCGQHFSSRSNFNSHVFHKHSDVRKHQCAVCPKSFKTRTQLKVHLRTHTGERPFKCPDCDYGSTTRGNMKAHLKSHNYTMERINTMVLEIAEKSSALDVRSMDKVMKEIAEKVKKGVLSAPEYKKQGSRKERDGKKSLKSKSNIVKTKDTGVNEEPIISSHVSVLPLETQNTEIETSKEGTSSNNTEPPEPVEESHIKRLLTEPLTSLAMPKLQLNFYPVVKKSEENELQENQSVQDEDGTNSSCKLEDTQAQWPKTTKLGSAESGANSLSSNVALNPKTVEKDSSALLSALSSSVSDGLVSCQGDFTPSTASENCPESVHSIYQLPLSSQITSVVQPSQPLIIPLVNSTLPNQTQPVQPPPVQLFVSSDLTGVPQRPVQIQQPTLHTIPTFAGNIQLLSAPDISSLLTMPNFGQLVQALSSSDTSQYIQILPAAEPTLPLGGNMAITPYSSMSQIVQLVEPVKGEVSAAAVAASGSSNSNFIESQCLLQGTDSSSVLPEVNAEVSVAANQQVQELDSVDNVSLPMCASASGDEKFVQQVNISSQQQQGKAEVLEQKSGHIQIDPTDQTL